MVSALNKIASEVVVPISGSVVVDEVFVIGVQDIWSSGNGFCFKVNVSLIGSRLTRHFSGVQVGETLLFLESSFALEIVCRTVNDKDVTFDFYRGVASSIETIFHETTVSRRNYLVYLVKKHFSEVEVTRWWREASLVGESRRKRWYPSRTKVVEVVSNEELFFWGKDWESVCLRVYSETALKEAEKFALEYHLHTKKAVYISKAF